jgi:hypothetical protein
MSPAPAGLFAAAGEIQEKLTRAGFRFCFIGGLALQRWGEPRYTRDIDLTLLCPFGDEVAVATRIARLVPPRIAGAVEFARESRVFLGEASDGTPVDIALGGIDFEARCVERASPFDFGGGLSLVTCSAEDLVVMKAFAGRGQDWVDVETIVVRRGPALDWASIDRELEPLLALKDSADARRRLADLRTAGS